ncbi:MAG: hypothetical protein A3F13_01675 [Gammaproteobacteria bacterium RIFCSPHIGHO2_12_FULL_40_19]|nr:MAG: hypothetical protein A3F13_01675 [Gammaproteobacteria bacterium RIFCSPHIGHO2_12_FULL_40_19]
MEAQSQINFWNQLQLIIETVCQEFDSQWQLRKRVLNTQFLVLFIFKLIMSKNKQGYNSVIGELWDSANSPDDLPQKYPVAASSICEARQKMPEIIFEKLNQAVLMHWNQTNIPPTWHGRRIFAVDGSKLNLPHELEHAGYKIQRKDVRYYPTGLMSTLYHLSEGMVYDFALESHLDERMCAIDHMDKMSEGDVMVLDRGYFSYLLLHKSIEKNIHIVCRMQLGTVNQEIKKFWDSQETDIVVNYTPSAAVISDLKKRGFKLKNKSTPLRLIKYKIDNETYVCGTTLIGEQYSIDEFQKLYHGRWGIEELYKISKLYIDVEDFHSSTERGVKQELYAHLLLINIARIFESEAKNKLPPPTATDKNIDSKNAYWQGFCENLQTIKINFKNCLLVVERYLLKLFFKASGLISDWLPKAISLIARVKQKIRPGRHYPRFSHKPIKKWASGNNPKSVGA